jgi:hypothetical protein
LLDTAETTLATTTFDSNIFWSTGGGSSGALGTGPNPGFGYTTHTCASLASLTILSNCINSDPQFTSYSPTAYYTIPASFNFTPAVGSPLISGGSITGGSVPGADVVGMAFDPLTPNIGVFSTAAAPPITQLPGSIMLGKGVGAIIHEEHR